MKGGSEHEFSQVFFSPNGKYVLSSTSYDAKLWSVDNGTLLWATSYGTSPMVGPSFVFSNDGRCLFFTHDSAIDCLDIELDSIVSTFRGQKELISSLALSSDGNLLLSAARDSTCAVWDLKARDPLKTIFTFKEQPFVVSFSKDGRSFLVAGYKTSSTFSTETGRRIHEFKSNYFSKSPNSDLLAVSFGHRAGYIGTNEIGIYEFSGRFIRTFTFKEKDGIAREFRLSSSGKYFVVSGDHYLRVYDTYTGAILKAMEGDVERPLAISPDERFIVTGMTYADEEIRRQGSAYINTVGIWDMQSGKLTHMLRTYQSGHLPPAFSKDSHFMVTAENSHELKIWEFPTGRMIHNLTEYLSCIDQIVSGPSNDLSASRTEKGEVFVWDQKTGKTVWAIRSYDLKASDVRFSSDGKALMTTTLHESERDKEGERPDYIIDTLKVFLWDADSGYKMKECDIPKAEWWQAAFSNDGSTLFIASAQNMEAWDGVGKTRMKSTTIDTYGGVGPFSPRVNYAFYFGDPTGAIRVWDIRNNKEAFRVQAHSNFVRTVSWSWDERTLVTSGQSDGMIKVWSVPDGTMLRNFKMNITEVQNANVSPSGRYFAGGNRSGTIEIWDLEGGNVIRTYNQFQSVISSIAWSTDEKLIFSASRDGTLVAWRTNL